MLPIAPVSPGSTRLPPRASRYCAGSRPRRSLPRSRNAFHRRGRRGRRETGKSDQCNYPGRCDVHSALGPGLLESAYQACLAYELTSRGLKVETQVPLPIQYRGVRLDAGYRLDLVVEDLVVVEI